ncbi:histone-lysine N-methyltransferase SETD1A-like [Mangifera indica]|uniref:histone-lysine N-methyltransferase SETD1A-like n=1 Tax=Mangifera indica TaxID=29780 RepID=UPI001CFA8828|nr:histone-lysine N-methyltransferase SETD1A-like [Mangifera indica]
MQESPLLSLSPSSPSFNSYSSANLAEIAARVVEEFKKESDLDSSIYEWETESLFSEEREREECEKNQDSNKNQEDEQEDENDEEEEFEFAIVCRRSDSAISADEIFFNGHIRPIYPVFDTSLLLNDTSINQNAENNNSSSSTPSLKTSTRLSLGKLMSEEREMTTSSSSSEADDLDNLQPGTYCVWKPKARSPHQDSPGRSCKKSNSTGSSKRWKFRDFLYRSYSDAKIR